MNAVCAALLTSPRSLASSARGADRLLVGLVVNGPSCGLAPPSRPQSMVCQERDDRRRDPAPRDQPDPGAAGRARRSRPAGPSDTGATSSSSTPISRDSTRGSSSAGSPMPATPPALTTRSTSSREVRTSPYSDSAQVVEQPYRTQNTKPPSRRVLPTRRGATGRAVSIGLGDHRRASALVSARSMANRFEPAGELS
jgi:hypothetical protein